MTLLTAVGFLDTLEEDDAGGAWNAEDEEESFPMDDWRDDDHLETDTGLYELQEHHDFQPPSQDASHGALAAAAAETPELSPEACFTLWTTQGRLELAEEMLNKWRRERFTVDLKYHKMLMRGYLQCKRLRMARRTFRLILSDHEPDLASYVLVILLHGLEMGLDKVETPQDAGQDKRPQLRKILKRMRREGHNLAEVHRHMVLSPEHRQIFLRAVRTVWPDFEPSEAHLIPSTWHRIGDVASRTPDSVKGSLGGPALEQWKRETATVVGVPVILTDSARRELEVLERRKGHSKSRGHSAESGHDFGLPCVVPRVEQALAKERAAMTASHNQRRSGAKGRAGSRHEDAVSQMFALSDTTLASIVCAQLGELVFRSGGAHGTPLSALSLAVGQQVFLRYFVETQVNDGVPAVLHTVYSEYAQRLNADVREVGREVWEDELEEQDILDDGTALAEFQWSEKAMVQIGTFLVDTVLKCARLCDLPNHAISLKGEDSTAEALFHTYDFRDGKILGVIKPHPTLVARRGAGGMGSMPRNYRVFRPTELPMLTVPKPWRSVDSSPYLVTPASLIRCRHDQYQHLALVAKMQHSIGEVYDALNYLSSCPWRINNDILDHVTEVYKTGRGFEDLAVPPEPSPVERTPIDIRRQMKPDELRKDAAKWRDARKTYWENLGLHADITSKLCIANAFRNDVFYLPHNIDFRGRAYTVPPHLSHIGGDLARALLRFSEARPLGERGLFWLKVHVANLSGVDKVSFDERVQYADDHLEQIYDTATNPFGDPRPGETMKWWRGTDAPWQTLAACIELHAALESGDPERFESSLPVHQDGTCNGLQHYAALGGDVEGAIAVNLSPVKDSNKPQDVYMRVVDRVNEMIAAHASGDFSGSKDLAQRFGSMSDPKMVKDLATQLVAIGPVARKTVKQTIMTSVYGVTFIGARDQIFKQLKALDLDMDKKDMSKQSMYLAACTFACLDEMFQQAHEIKGWLRDAAFSISKTGTPVTWLTPMNLPVIQPYHTAGKHSLATSLQRLTYVNSTNITMPANPSKQKTAFPPNFVHSLDSAHMMYTANACNQAGARFVSVHDSFWTHASTVDVMNIKLREQFVRLHSQPLLPRLYEHFNLQHNGQPHLNPKDGISFVDISEPPPRGDFDITDVLRSPYFFN